MEKSGQRKLIEQLIVGSLIGAVLGVLITKAGWHGSPLFTRNFNHFDYDVEWNRLTPSLILWFSFFAYWTIVSVNSAKTKSSESKASTFTHQIVLNGALIILFAPVPGLRAWFLPQRYHFLVVVGVIIQIGFGFLAIWARRHLGRNWSAEVRIGEGHQLVRTGPYRFLRHPIYTAMLGMFLGTAIASSQVHALLALGILFIAYLRKTRLEEQILHQTFGPDWLSYRRQTWALVPPLF